MEQDNKKDIPKDAGSLEKKDTDCDELGASSNARNIPSDKPQHGNLSPGILSGNIFSSFIPPSPPSFISMEQIMKAAEDVSKLEFNMTLAHEIAVNKDFKLEQRVPLSQLEEKIRETFHNAFWDILQERLSSTPPDYSHAVVLLTEIKEILIGLLMPHNARLKNEINEVLDVDLIEQQAQKGTVDVSSYAQFIISTMARICAPARDENIRELRQLTETVPLYKEEAVVSVHCCIPVLNDGLRISLNYATLYSRGILETLNLMKLDLMNFTISHIRPHIQRHSIEYEKDKFQEILHSLEGLSPPVDGLKFTRLWLKNAYEECMKESNGEDPLNAVVLRRAYIKILQWKEMDSFPETLHLDHARFITLKDNLTAMILTASVILVTYSYVGPSIQGIADFKETLKEHIQILLADASQCSEMKDLEAKMEAVALQVAKEVNLCLDAHGYLPLEKEKEEILISSIKNIAADDHSVRQLICKRILEFLDLLLHSSTPLKIPAGLSSLQKELSAFAGHFLSLVQHNQAVFVAYYDQIINEQKGLQ